MSGAESEASICERNRWTMPVGMILLSPKAPETDGASENHMGTKAHPSPDVGVMHPATSLPGTGVIDTGVPLEWVQLRIGVLLPVPVLATDAAEDVHWNFCGGGSKGSSNTSTKLSGKKVAGAKCSWVHASLAASETSKCSCVSISFLLRSLAFSALKKANSSSIPDRGEEVDGADIEEIDLQEADDTNASSGSFSMRSSWQRAQGTYRSIKSLCFFEATISKCGMSFLSAPIIFAPRD